MPLFLTRFFDRFLTTFMLIQCPARAGCQMASKVAVALLSSGGWLNVWRSFQCLERCDLRPLKGRCPGLCTCIGGMQQMVHLAWPHERRGTTSLHFNYASLPMLWGWAHLERNFIMFSLSLHWGTTAGPVVSGVWREAGIMNKLETVTFGMDWRKLFNNILLPVLNHLVK